MKNALIILLISLTSFYGTGCNTHPDIHSQTLPKDTTTTNTHDDYTQFYYKAESDTILTYEALQRQYDHYNRWCFPGYRFNPTGISPPEMENALATNVGPERMEKPSYRTLCHRKHPSFDFDRPEWNHRSTQHQSQHTG